MGMNKALPNYGRKTILKLIIAEIYTSNQQRLLEKVEGDKMRSHYQRLTI